MSLFDVNVARLNANPAAVEVLRGLCKEASLAGMIFDKGVGGALFRTLGGAAGGALLGGGLGGGLSALRGEDVAAGARKGAIGGGVLGGLGGALHGASTLLGNPVAPNYAGVSKDLLEKGTMGLGMATGTAAGSLLASSVLGSNADEVKNQAAKEVGRFEGLQQIKAQQAAQLAPLHDRAFQEAHHEDDVLAGADPRLMQSAYTTMKRFAPNLASDPNAVRSFLRESATWGTPPSYATLKNLADAEQSVTRAGGTL